MKTQLSLVIIAIAAIAIISCARQNEITDIEYEKIECKNNDYYYIRIPKAGQNDALDSVRHYLLNNYFFFDDSIYDIQESIDNYYSQMRNQFVYLSPLDTFFSDNRLIQYKSFSTLMKAGIESEGTEYIVFDAETGRKIEITDIFSDLQLILIAVQEKAKEIEETAECDMEWEAPPNPDVVFDIYDFYIANDSIAFNFDITWESFENYLLKRDTACPCLSKEDLRPYVKPNSVLYKYWYKND